MIELHLGKPSTMKMVKLIATLLSLFFCFYSNAAVVPNTHATPTFDFTKIKARDIERFTGQRLTLFQKVKLKIAQKLLKKFEDEQITDKQEKQARASMLLGIGSLLLLFLSSALSAFALLCLPAAILAVVLGIKSLKGNSNAKGIVGLVTGSVTLLLVILAIIIVAAFIAAWG